MPATPNITLTATLLDYSGATIGSAAQPAWLRIALCGFGPVLPRVTGTGNLAKISSWFVDLPFTGTALSVPLWGNDQITPSATYYTVSVLDANKNVVQTGAYVFSGGPLTVDLSSAPQMIPQGVPQMFNLVTNPLTGTTPGTVFTIPTKLWGTNLAALFYRGVFYPAVLGAVTNYTVSNQTVTMNFACTEAPIAIYIQALP